MTAFPDCSFLCALYRSQDNSGRANACFQTLEETLAVTSLLLLEFRQSIRLQNFLFARDRTRGFPLAEGQDMLGKLQANLVGGVLLVVPVDWPSVHVLAEQISARHTREHGHRTLDLLHVATALYFGAGEFLTFDARQAALAAAEGLRVRP